MGQTHFCPWERLVRYKLPPFAKVKQKWCLYNRAERRNCRLLAMLLWLVDKVQRGVRAVGMSPLHAHLVVVWSSDTAGYSLRNLLIWWCWGARSPFHRWCGRSNCWVPPPYSHPYHRWSWLSHPPCWALSLWAEGLSPFPSFLNHVFLAFASLSSCEFMRPPLHPIDWLVFSGTD